MHATGIRLVPRAPAAKRVGAAIAASVLACAVAGAAIAQSSAPGRQEPVPEQEPAGEAPRLGTVVVTATRQPAQALLVPAAIDSIDADAIRRAQPRIDLSETLHRIPGVVARDRHNQAQDLQVSIRGFGARSTFGVRGVRLFTDGIPATMPDGQGQLSHFPLQSAGRIEVLRGPFSALYGNASGGVIELFTAPAPPRPELEAGFVAGADALQRASVSWRAPWGVHGDGDVLVDAVELDSDGYRHHSAARRSSAQALLRGSLAAGTRYTLLANQLDLTAQDPQGLDAAQLQGDRRAASAGALLFDTRKRVEQLQVGARIEHGFSPAHVATLTAHAGNRQTTQMLSVPIAVQRNVPLHNGGTIDLDRDYHGVDARWTWSSRLLDRDFALTGGVQYEVADELRRGFENFVLDAAGTPQPGLVGALRRHERNRVTGQDAYLQAEWAPAERWRLHAGVRRSQVRFRSADRFITDINPDDSGALRYARTSPVAGVLFRTTPTLSVYANAGGGFETPTFSELAYRSDGGSGLNAALQPSRSRNLELGVRSETARLRWSGAVFHTSTEDELVVVANEGGRSVYGNANGSRRRGLELALQAQLSPRWHLTGSYTFLDARYREDFSVCRQPPCDQEPPLLITAGRHLPGLSRHHAWAELRLALDDTADVMLQARAVGRIFVDDANSEAAPGHARLDLAAERRFALGALDLRAFARIDNLLDRAYVGSVIVNDGNGRYYEPAPGRGWMLGIALTHRFR